MKSFSVAALLVVIASAVNAIMVNTPASVVECQPLLITWVPTTGNTGPFFLSIVPGNSPYSPALFSWSGLTGTSFTWIVTEPAGTSLGLLLRDETGATSQSAPFTVQSGTTDCLSSGSSLTTTPVSSSLSVSGSSSSSSSSSSLSTTSTSSHTTTTTTTTPITTPTTTTPKPPVSSSSSSSSSTSSSPSPSTSGNSTGNNKSGAVGNAVNFGSVGFLAALVGAVLA